MLLFYRGDVDNHLLLEIANGGLHAKALSEDSEMVVRFPGLVSDGDWRDAHVFVDNFGLVLIVKGPGCDRDGCRVIDGGPDEPPFQLSEAFMQMYIGGAPEELLDSTISRTGFIGCMEDLMIDSKPILPQMLPEDQGHELGCSKTEWCEPDPCHGNGLCVDLWNSFLCDCHRPFYTESCSEGRCISTQKICQTGLCNTTLYHPNTLTNCSTSQYYFLFQSYRLQ